MENSNSVYDFTSFYCFKISQNFNIVQEIIKIACLIDVISENTLNEVWCRRSGIKEVVKVQGCEGKYHVQKYSSPGCKPQESGNC